MIQRCEPAVSSDALKQLERRLHRAENELAAGDVLRDNLRTDREKVYLFQLCDVNPLKGRDVNWLHLAIQI